MIHRHLLLLCFGFSGWRPNIVVFVLWVPGPECVWAKTTHKTKGFLTASQQLTTLPSEGGYRRRSKMLSGALWRMGHTCCGACGLQLCTQTDGHPKGAWRGILDKSFAQSSRVKWQVFCLIQCSQIVTSSGQSQTECCRFECCNSSIKNYMFRQKTVLVNETRGSHIHEEAGLQKVRGELGCVESIAPWIYACR